MRGQSNALARADAKIPFALLSSLFVLIVYHNVWLENSFDSIFYLN